MLASLRAATNEMDEAEATTGSRILFITPTLKGMLDDFSLANPARSNRVLERFSRVVEVPQTRFFSAIALNSGEEDRFGYSRAEDGTLPQAWRNGPLPGNPANVRFEIGMGTQS